MVSFRYKGKLLVGGRARKHQRVAPVLLSDVPLSFWGGIDPQSGEVVDRLHPLFGEQVQDSIVCLPSGRGSCTASQVLLELILHGKAPTGIVLRDVDGLVCVGALVAQEVFGDECSGQVPDIVAIGSEGYESLLRRSPAYACVTAMGDILTGDTESDVEDQLVDEQESGPPKVQLAYTYEEKAMLMACGSKAERTALAILIRYAHLTAAPVTPTYLEVSKAHIDGCTYIGNGGLRFVQNLVRAGGRVKIPTTLNSVSADRRRWQQMGVPSERAIASVAVGDAYLELGCHPHSFTCAPYLLENPPTLHEHIVWGESNAVVYANSILGARTEKYADYLDLCCALVGKVPAYGVHLDQNRRPHVVLDATRVLEQVWDGCSDIESLFPVLGHLSGTLSGGKVPILTGFEGERWKHFVTLDHWKAFCAAFGTTGTSPLIHIAGVTPEARDVDTVKNLVKLCGDNRRVVTLEQLRKTHAALDSCAGSPDHHVDLIALGNPHLSLAECKSLARLVEEVGSPTKHPDIRIMACISRALYNQALQLGYATTLEAFGVEFVNDTCWCMMLDQPVIPADPKAIIMTNSGKYAHYGPGLTGRRFRFGTMEDCVKAATNKVYHKQKNGTNSPYPSWLTSDRTGAGRRTYVSASRDCVRQTLRSFLLYTRRWR